jgi:hypothetical protein
MRPSKRLTRTEAANANHFAMSKGAGTGPSGTKLVAQDNP